MSDLDQITGSPCVGTTPASAPPLSWLPHGTQSSPACPEPYEVGHPHGTLKSCCPILLSFWLPDSSLFLDQNTHLRPW
uniref:Uncharacterized protein n=1 Tax=Anguilla anguilla TaxID=7936 RepID=A0A0E9XMQ3_ANGAN